MTLDQIEHLLNALQHVERCPVNKPHHLCECGLSEGRRILLNYLESMRLQIAKTN